MIDGSNHISGAGFSDVKVASYDDSSGSWIYKWEEPYAGVGISPNNLATDDIKRICPYLIGVEKRNGLSAKPGNVRTDDESDIYVPIALIAISLLAIFIDMVDMDCLTDKDHSVLNLKEYKERLLL